MRSMIQKRRNVWASRAFQPDRISGLVGWFDMADGGSFTLATGISSLRNKASIGGFATQATGASQPGYFANQLRGYGAMRGNGSQWLDFASFPSLANGYTIYAVSESSGATNGAVVSINAPVTASAMVIGNDSTVGSYVSAWGAAVAQPAPAAGTNFARMIKYDGAHTAGGYRIRLSTQAADTTGSMTQNVGTPPSGTLRILRADTTYSARNLFEIIIFDRQTTTDEDARLKRYITDKWGLAWL